MIEHEKEEKKFHNLMQLRTRGIFYAVNCQFLNSVAARWQKNNLALFFCPLDISPCKLVKLDIENEALSALRLQQMKIAHSNVHLFKLLITIIGGNFN